MLDVERIGRQHYALTESANQLTQSITLGKMVRYRPQAADCYQGISTQTQGLAGDMASIAE
jgi:hypothetical protein